MPRVGEVKPATDLWHPAVIYLRVSTKGQAERSFPRQERICREWAKRHLFPFTIVRVFREIGPGWGSLPIRQQAVEFADSISAPTIVECEDRFSRAPGFDWHKEECLIPVFELDESPCIPTHSGWVPKAFYTEAKHA